MRLFLTVLLGHVLVVPCLADGPADNHADHVRRIPREGIEVPASDRAELEKELASLQEKLDRLGQSKEGRIADLIPDVLIFREAVHDALTYHEFFATVEIVKARDLLQEGHRRADQLLQGQAPWTTQKGLVVRGYRSKIDGSIQPFGLVVPDSYTTEGPSRYRLDVWFHGRGETLSEVNFLHERMRNPGTFTPRDTIVLHPYGRYCNAFKLAGEVDVYEALDSVRSHYRIDDDRTAVRGFSMGGAAAWHFAVHDASRWFAANPGAGFSETPLFLDVFQKENLAPTWYERKLWHLYDCPDWVVNLRQCPTVAYSGALDNQKQAADVMAAAMERHGNRLTHILGPGTKHAYEPGARLEVERRLDAIAENGRERIPHAISFQTYTLRYNRMNWLTVDALDEHWAEARVEAQILGDDRVLLALRNVAALTIEMPPGSAPLTTTGEIVLQLAEIELDTNLLGEELDPPILEVPGPASDRSWRVSIHREGSTWKLGPMPSDAGLRKRHGLQGPIDDAFMDSFVFVRPTGQSPHEKLNAWTSAELDHAIEHWRRHFRGEARVVEDSALTDEQIASSNLVLWGDPSSNAVLQRIADKLPIRWESESIQVGDDAYSTDDHALILIAPNPLNPDRYVVLNSSFTFREYDYLNNARQVPKLPDWAVIDLRTPPDSRFPGKVVAADFFGEHWELRPNREPSDSR